MPELRALVLCRLLGVSAGFAHRHQAICWQEEAQSAQCDRCHSHTPTPMGHRSLHDVNNPTPIDRLMTIRRPSLSVRYWKQTLANPTNAGTHTLSQASSVSRCSVAWRRWAFGKA